MEKLMCKKSFSVEEFDFIEGQKYFYWNNFQGLNHFISDREYSSNNQNIIVFDGLPGNSRTYLYDYFWTKEEEYRDLKIEKIIEKLC